MPEIFLSYEEDVAKKINKLDNDYNDEIKYRWKFSLFFLLKKIKKIKEKFS